MSFDLGFWYQKPLPTVDEAEEVYDRLTGGLTGVVEESSAVEDFLRAVVEIFPDLAEENMHESPWASGIYATPECVLVAISWSRADEVSLVLHDLASTYGLVVYDPQNGTVGGVAGNGRSVEA